MRRKSCHVLFLLVTLSTAGASQWKPYRAIPLASLQARTTPVTGETEAWMVKAVTPVGRRFLALVQHQRNKLSPWVDEQALKEDINRQGFIGEDKQVAAKFQDELLLMLVNHDGRIVAQSSPRPEIEHWSGLFHNTRAPLLAMEEGDTCQYALLEPVANKLFCFDLQLQFQRSVDIPLDVTLRPGVVREGNDYYLFSFGWKFAHFPMPSNSDAVLELVPEKPESLGVVFKVGEWSAVPLPVSPHQLWRELNRIARDPHGEKLKLQQAGLAVFPVQRLSPRDYLDVLITAVSSADFARYSHFQGLRLFFRGTLSRNGLTKVMQLPFWVVQEEGRREAEIDTDRGALFLPSFADVDQLQAFEFAPNRLGVSFEALYKRPKEDGSYDLHVWENARFFVSFSGQNVTHVYEFDEDFRKGVAKALATREAETYPLKIWGLAGPRLFAFAGVAINGLKEPAQIETCLVLLELEE